MSEVIDRQQAKRLFLRAVELIHLTDTPLLPRYLQLFFEYAEGANQTLKDAVDKLLQQSPKPSPSELDLIFELHVTDQDLSIHFSRMGERYGEELRDALAAMHEAVSSTSEFDDSVKMAETQFGDFSDPERVRQTITSLVEATKLVSRSNAETNEKLTASVDQIEQLQTDLNKIKIEAQKDSLTSLANRKCLDETIIREISEAEKNKRPLSLCMVDIDHFKKFNDTYGHQAGDAALRFVASILQHSVREYDLVARYGGEEFTVVMPDTELAIGVAISNRMREALSGKELTKRSTSESLGFITASIGIAQLRNGDTPESLIVRADRALYEAKQAGRNRVHSELNEATDNLQPVESVA